MAHQASRDTLSRSANLGPTRRMDQTLAHAGGQGSKRREQTPVPRGGELQILEPDIFELHSEQAADDATIATMSGVLR